MSKEVVAKIKLEIVAGQASPAPPVGPALGQHGANIMEFVRQFNDRTGKMEEGTVIPVDDHDLQGQEVHLRRQDPARLLPPEEGRRASPRAPGAPNKDKVGKVTRKQIEEIARIKLPDLNAYDIEAARKIIEGTARNMGLEIVSE